MVFNVLFMEKQEQTLEQNNTSNRDNKPRQVRAKIDVPDEANDDEELETTRADHRLLLS